ncbi:replicative DNA helicase [Candidatus Babeliales bacterium]|nr:replicative DNA helicase [Candidatus Babeliales bacterium]
MQKRKQEQRNLSIAPETILGKELPFNTEAEKAVLGAILLDDQTLSSVSDFLLAQDFYSAPHRIVYETILELAEKFNRVDLVTLQDELKKKDQLEAIGGSSYLLSLQDEIPSAGMIESHARIIKEKSVLRDLIGSAVDIITTCYDQQDKAIEAVLDNAEKTIFNISHKRANQSFTQLNIWLKRTFQHINEIKTHAHGITGVPSGFAKLDHLTSGFQKSDLIVVAGRPSMGKTGIALNAAINAARHDFTVGFFSLEMSAEQLTLRLLSSESGIPHHNIRNATITSDEWLTLTNVASSLASRKIFIDDTAMLNVMELRAKARKLKAEHGLQLLIVDYLQLLRAPGRHENRHQEVSEISRALKALAKELAIPVIALSQLSRAVDSRMDKRPMLSDLRESGAIEQDADLIMFLYRDVVYHPETDNPALAELIIGKQRNGPTGTAYLNFLKELTKFEDAEYEQ